MSYKKFTKEGASAEVQFVIIGRDSNIIKLQQQRVTENIHPFFIKQINNIISNYKTIFQDKNWNIHIDKLENWLEKEIGSC